MPWEVRWFEKDIENYKVALEWFKKIDTRYSKENIREDRYIFLPNCTDIGIKLRPFNDERENTLRSRLEIKWRKNVKPNFEVPSRPVYGIMEEWLKCGWILDEHSGLTCNGMDFFSAPNNRFVVKIKKLRFLRRYLIQDNIYRSVEWINLEKEEGLQCEITKIMKENGLWWSIGFESLGKKINQGKFRKIVEDILIDFKLKLERKNSVGYPEWINVK